MPQRLRLDSNGNIEVIEVGPQGPPGARGADGPQGPPGADGADGSSLLPPAVDDIISEIPYDLDGSRHTHILQCGLVDADLIINVTASFDHDFMLAIITPPSFSGTFSFQINGVELLPAITIEQLEVLSPASLPYMIDNGDYAVFAWRLSPTVNGEEYSWSFSAFSVGGIIYPQTWRQVGDIHYRLENGSVRVQGMVDIADIGMANDVIGVLPSGYRPNITSYIQSVPMVTDYGGLGEEKGIGGLVLTVDGDLVLAGLTVTPINAVRIYLNNVFPLTNPT